MTKEECNKILEPVVKELQDKLDKDGIVMGDDIFKILEKYGIVSNIPYSSSKIGLKKLDSSGNCRFIVN